MTTFAWNLWNSCCTARSKEVQPRHQKTLPTQVNHCELTDYTKPFHHLPFENLHHNPLLTDGTITLIIKERHDLIKWKQHVDKLPIYKFTIVNAKNHGLEYGELTLRVGNDLNVFWNGHVGYGVRKEHRGNRFARRGSVLAIQFVRIVHGLETVYITCDCDNIESLNTLKGMKDGGAGVQLGVFKIPEGHPLIQRGMREVYVFRFGPKCLSLEPPLVPF
ncbi:hypothetical protein BDR26DRAFT_850660 [Obelidium mucronatum]|nr:hypothetical protein BDR26DRAFT_850660 [Obelidium mucronatum]